MTTLVTGAGAGALLTLLLLTLAPLAWGWQPLVVTSGSMGPLVRPGDVVLVQPDPDDVVVGSVVTFRAADDGLVTHRVAEVTADGYVTRGDANPVTDSTVVHREDLVGRVRALVPWVGLPAVAVRGGADASGAGTTGAAFVAQRTNGPQSLGTSSRFYRDAVVRSGPVSYWRLDETGGTTAADTMGVAPLTIGSGTAFSRPGALRSESNAAIKAPPFPELLQAGAVPAHDIAGSFTVLAWVRATSLPQNSLARVVTKRDPNGTTNYMLAFSSDGLSIRALTTTTTGSYEVAAPVPQDLEWHMLAATWDGAHLRVYVDGAVGGTLAGTGTPRTVTPPLTLSYGTSPLRGEIDEAAVWSRALTSAEILRLYRCATG
ncbi:signal peptidase I [Cellulomonas sp. SLBN-39]|uniref:signal peptidase I n=1 Tax=Cellulomonas sp. SLBN-39 TaxID=2768446 RepID=UPI0011667D92|nr:signal peptidase I [Cellulomonas sp. SLBN-39]TQL02634.1 signal peptidase [Cellulomonas sp. SLBN-39]